MTQPDPQLFQLAHASEPGRTVRGRVYLPAGEVPTSGWPAAIVLHGFKGFMDWGFFPMLSRGLAERGIAAVAFNFSGSGIGEDLESFSEHDAFAKDTFSRQLEDVADVRAWMARAPLPIDPQRLGVFGHSRGGGVALLHAAESGDYASVVTWAAIPTVQRFDEETCRLWRQQGFLLIPNQRLGIEHRLDLDALEDAERHRERLDIQAACSRLHAPVLLIQGAADDVVEPESASILRAALPENSAMELLIPAAGHTFGARHPMGAMTPELTRALDATWSWFVQHIASDVMAGSPDDA